MDVRLPLVDRLVHDERGIAAVEFAMLLPVMLLMYVGTAGVTEAVFADRQMNALTITVADMTAQQAATVGMTDTQAQSIFNASTVTMAPFPTTSLQMTLSNVEFVPNVGSVGSNGLDARTRWTVTFSSGTLRPCAGNPALSPVANGTSPTLTTMPLGLYTQGFMIVADVTYTYTPSFGKVSLNFGAGTWNGSYPMRHTAYMRPRNTDNIHYVVDPSTGGLTASVCPLNSWQSANTP